jgi:hypothetical protein
MHQPAVSAHSLFALSLSLSQQQQQAFTQKSGPIFYFQDAVEATLVWDDWAWTAMWMLIAGIVGACYGGFHRLYSPSLSIARPHAGPTLVHAALRRPASFAHSHA